MSHVEQLPCYRGPNIIHTQFEKNHFSSPIFAESGKSRFFVRKLEKNHIPDQGCKIFAGTTYQNWENVTE
jgi:hypothetical protein